MVTALLYVTAVPTPTTGTTYAWDFGDGTNSTATAPTHKYSKQGTYNVTLVATLNGCVAKSVQRAYQFEKPKAAFAKLSEVASYQTCKHSGALTQT